MELPNQEGDMQMQMQMPIPLNSAYGGGHTHSHGHVHHMIHHDPPPASSVPQVLLPAASNNGPIGGVVVSSSISNHEDQDNIVPNYKKNSVKYKECLKNHAASMGGNATDGCGEFMPSGEEGTLEALTCSACNCHRNFHRKEIDGDLSSNYDTYHHHHHHHPSILSRAAAAGRKMIMGMGHHHKGILGTDLTTGALVPSRVTPAPVPPPHHHHPMSMIMSYNMGSMPSESDEQEGGVGGGGGGGGGVVMTRPTTHHMVKKRYRTKFTQEQKEKMFNFAEKSGWKIQKQEESVVQQFCQEIGVRRRVLKVWMHNNKHNLTKKNNSSDAPNQV